MRALTLIAVSALAGLWGYFGSVISEAPTGRPVPVAATAGGADAGTLNNTGVGLFEQGRHADALAYFRRAHEFRPGAGTIETNYQWQRARVRRVAWEHALGILTTLAALLLFGGHAWRGILRWRDRCLLRRLKLSGARVVEIGPDTREAELDLRFSESLGCVARRHPPNVVWTCASHNQHMKSRRSIKVKGRECRVKLDRKKIEQLRRFPGLWRCILRLGKTEVGEAAARVG